MDARSFCSALAVVLSLALSFLSMPAHAWVPVYRSGPIYYTPACDPIVGGCQSNGTGYFVSQQWNPTTGNPRVATVSAQGQILSGDVFYVSIYMQGIALIPRYMAVYFIPPPGTLIVADPNLAELECYYTPRGGGAQRNFTRGPITDDTVAGTLVISGCPQPVASSTQPPFPIVSSGAGPAYKIARVKQCPTCAEPPSTNWPMQSGAAYEFLIPLVATRPLDGFSDSDRFIAPIGVLQADFGIYWTYPNIPLYTAGTTTPLPQTTDLRAQLSLGTTTMPGMTRVQASCVNGGTGSSNSTTCIRSGVPIGATSTCNVTTPTTLAAGQSINCTIDFPSPTVATTLTLEVDGFANDTNAANDKATLTIQPPARPQGTADLVTTLKAEIDTTQGIAQTSSVTRIVGRCTNAGPDTATAVSCTLVGLPDGVTSSCVPTSPQATLAKDAYIECTAEFPTQEAALPVSMAANSPTNDPSTANRTQSVVIEAAMFIGDFE